VRVLDLNLKRMRKSEVIRKYISREKYTQKMESQDDVPKSDFILPPLSWGWQGKVNTVGIRALKDRLFLHLLKKPDLSVIKTFC
jgi:hypothetical protein